MDGESKAGNGRAGLRPTDQVPADTVATVDLEDRTVTDTWRSLFSHQSVRDVFVRAVRSFAEGRTPGELYDTLDGRGVPGPISGLVDKIARGDRSAAWKLVADVAPALGTGHSTVEDLLATATLFDAVKDTPPALAILVRSDFRDRRREQRVDLCRLVARLSRGFDVRLVATGLTRAFLAHEHREHLPGVSEWRNTTQVGTTPEATASDALAELDPDGRELSILREVAEEPAETLSYGDLYERAQVSKARVRQAVGRLTDFQLVERFGPPADRKVELLTPGRDVIDAVDAKIGRQRTLEEGVSETGNSHTQAVLSAQAGEGEEDVGPYTTAFLDRPRQDALAATATAGGISLSETPLSDGKDAEDRRVRYVSFDTDRREVLVSVRAAGPLQHIVSLATALASPALLDRALSDTQLRDLSERPAILRGARCIGSLSDDALADPEELRQGFNQWRQDLETLTTDLHRGEYDDRDDLRATIMRSAHGLAGSIVHLLDAVEIDVVREVRIPSGLDRDHLDELARSVGIGAAIQSQYGVFAPYRQLFETVAGEPPLSPEVDATDPSGELIGGYVLRGPDVGRISSHLRKYLRSPAEPNDDAPEFAVEVPVDEPGREAFATAIKRTLSRKDLNAPPSLVDTLRAFVPSPYDATAALHRSLATADTHRGRSLRPDELRLALRKVPAKRVLPDLPPTVGKVVATLLDAEEPLTQTALADKADVSPRSIRNNRDRLEALDLVRIDGTTYRLALSFRDSDERGEEFLPEPATDEVRTFLEVVGDVVLAALGPERYANPEDPVAGHLFHPVDPWGIVDENVQIAPWIRLAGRLTGTDPPNEQRATVSMGPTVTQSPLVDDPPEPGLTYG